MSDRPFKQRLIGKILSIKPLTKLLYICGGSNLLSSIYMLSWDHGNRDVKDIVICLDRLHFSRDVEELRKNKPEYNWIKAPEDLLGHIQNPFIPRKYQNQTQFSDAKKECASDPFLISQKQAEIILKKCLKRGRVKAAINANVDFWQSEGMRRACRAMNIPFIVLCREVQTIPATYEEDRNHYLDFDFKYMGHCVAVHNERTANMYRECGFCDNDDDIIVTGPPRLDIWLPLGANKPSVPQQKKSVTLLSFFTGYFATDLFYDCMRVLSTLSKDPDLAGYEFVLKCKSKTDKIDITKDLNNIDIDVSCITFSYESDLKKVFESSEIVIGYNTLALIEAVLSDAKCIVPDWGAAQKNVNYNNILPSEKSRKVISFPTSPDEMKDFIKQSLLTPNALGCVEDKVSFVEDYFAFKANETASQRVVNVIKRANENLMKSRGAV